MDKEVKYILSEQIIRLIKQYGKYLSLGKEKKKEYSIDEILNDALVVAIRQLVTGGRTKKNV